MPPSAVDEAGTPAHLARLIAQAEASLTAAAGGAALCTFTKSGVEVPGVKYAEGRWAALRAVARDRRCADAALLPGVTHEVRDRWRADLARRRSTAAGRDWIAYLSGGVDVLDELLGARSTTGG